MNTIKVIGIVNADVRKQANESNAITLNGVTGTHYNLGKILNILSESLGLEIEIFTDTRYGNDNFNLRTLYKGKYIRIGGMSQGSKFKLNLFLNSENYDTQLKALNKEEKTDLLNYTEIWSTPTLKRLHARFDALVEIDNIVTNYLTKQQNDFDAVMKVIQSADDILNPTYNNDSSLSKFEFVKVFTPKLILTVDIHIHKNGGHITVKGLGHKADFKGAEGAKELIESLRSI